MQELSPEKLVDIFRWKTVPSEIPDDLYQLERHIAMDDDFLRGAELQAGAKLRFDSYRINDRLVQKAFSETGSHRDFRGFIITRGNWGVEPEVEDNVQLDWVFVGHKPGRGFVYDGQDISEMEMNKLATYLSKKEAPVGSGPHAGYTILSVYTPKRASDVIRSGPNLRNNN